MRVFVVAMIVIINFLIQSTILQYFRVLDILPNTSLLVVVVFSILWGKKRGATIGFFVGLLQDILLGSMIGTNSLIYMTIGYSIGIFEKNIYKDNYLTPVFFTIIATVIYHLIYYVIMYMTYNTLNIFLLFRKIIFLEGIYNSFLSIFVYRVIFHITKQTYMKVRIR